MVCFLQNAGSLPVFSYLYFMKNFVVIACVVFFLSACNRNGNALKEKIGTADSVAINFFKGDGTMDTVVAVKIVRDKQSVEKLTSLICSASAALKNNCGYDGSIHYFKNNIVIQDIDFRMNSADCSQFSFLLDGQRVATELTGEGRLFLSGLKK